MIAHELGSIRKSLFSLRPLIHCITNPISINQCANAILSTGCRPIMAEHPEEVGEITDTADSLMLNLGNITDARMKSIKTSAGIANKKNIPFVIDMVGIACSKLRRKFALDLIENYCPTVIKGNYSEVNALYDSAYSFAGVDTETSLDTDYISSISAKLARKYNTIILASGKTDIVTDRKRIIYIKNGTPQLAGITGTGCILGALCACYLSVCRDVTAAAAACAVLGICGELSETDKGCGNFMVNLMDNLSVLSDTDIENRLKLEEKNIEKF